MVFVYDIVGIIFIALGVFIFPLPIPLGIVFIALGVIILSIENKSVQELVRQIRAKNPRLNAYINKSRERVPGFAQRVIDATDPDA